MVTEKKVEALKTYFVFLAREDYVTLARYLLDVEEELGLGGGGDALEAEPEVARNVTLRIISDLLKAGLVRPGSLGRGAAFEPWPLGPEEATARIEREWDELRRTEGRKPDLYDIVWFEATGKGEKAVARYSPKSSGLAAEEQREMAETAATGRRTTGT